MISKTIKTIAAMVAVLLAMVERAECQRVARVNIPHSVCAGMSVPVTFGYDTTRNVVVSSPQSTLGHSERIFLPDGVSCGTMGCSYRSPVNFTAFGDDDTISSVEDIEYVKINIEHSYIADIYINITCPNGQKADIMRFGGTADSECSTTISQGSRGWLSGENASLGSYFGEPEDYEDNNNPCDSSSSSNAPGVGWNYCWSNNSTSGYGYASGDGIVYRAGHAFNNRIDSSNVVTGTNFYHPDQNFSSLIGCPLNGEWYIEVLDGYSVDNGYLFGWELALDASLIEDNQCVFDSFAVDGPWVTQVNDSTFTLEVPADLSDDLQILYHFHAYDNCGNVLDTSAYISFHPVWSDTVRQQAVENELPVVFCGEEFYDSVDNRVFTLTSVYGCDSMVHYYLKVWHNVETTVDTVVCETALPMQWRGYSFSAADTGVMHYHTVHGADSTVWLILRVRHQDTIQVRHGICEGGAYTWIDGVTYTDVSQHPVVTLPSQGVCDSVLRLSLVEPEDPFVAEMKLLPNPVPMSNPVCTAIDVSYGSRGREWYIMERRDTARSVAFSYPMNEDSVEVVLVAYNDMGCRDSVSGMVYADRAVFWAPNAFTPNEQTNQYFKVPSYDVLRGEVQIYDRAGRHIVTFDLLYGSWDGTMKGEPCPQGTYVWHIKYVPLHQPQIEKEAIGTVTLLR